MDSAERVEMHRADKQQLSLVNQATEEEPRLGAEIPSQLHGQEPCESQFLFWTVRAIEVTSAAAEWG